MMETVESACCENCNKFLQHGVCEYFNKKVKNNDYCDEWEYYTL